MKEWSKYDNLGHLKELINVQGGTPLGPKHPFDQRPGGVQEAVLRRGTNNSTEFRVENDRS